MFQNLASIIPRRRVKTVIWLTGIVVGIQFFVFVAVQVRWKESLFTEDCSTPKIRSGIVNLFVFHCYIELLSLCS